MGCDVREARPLVRLTGILVYGGCLLIVRQVLHERSRWNLPGGSLELGETLDQCLRRELLEETGLTVRMGDLLYVTDRFKGLGHHVVDMSFAIEPVGPQGMSLLDVTGALPSRVCPDGERLAAARLVPFGELAYYGLGERFVRLCEQGFPSRGSYQGDFHAFYGTGARRSMRMAACEDVA
ncbi:MAG: NUDIX hydrolase [Coriobacteriales bacterium]|jgi:ADP-ribose pyrophosphatase YjhB (NUDIX family)